MDMLSVEQKISIAMACIYNSLCRWRAVVVFIAGVALFAGILFRLGGYLIDNSSYAANKSQVYLNFLYASFVFSFAYSYFLLKYFFSKRVLLINAAGIVLAALIVLINRSNSFGALVYVSISMLLLYLLIISNRFRLATIENMYVKGGVGFCALALVFVPYLYGQMINPESFVLKETLLNEGKSSIRIRANPVDANQIIENFKKLEGVGFERTPHPVILKDSNSRLEIIGSVGDDLSIACLFISTDLRNAGGKIQSPNDCDNMVGVNSKLTFREKQSYLNGLRFIRGEYRDLIHSKLDEFIFYDEKSDSYPGVEAMLIRGYTMHHYNSILQGYGGGYFDSFYNQYGFGPISVGKIIRDTLGLTNFDSVYVSIYVVNLALFFVILVLFGFEPVILIGYMLSLLVVYEFSAILAPFIYAIRAIPAVLIVLLSLSKYNDRRWANPVLAVLFFIAGFYNKEYAFITASSALVIGYTAKATRYYFYAGLAFIGFIAAYYLASPQHVEGANFIALFLGVGFGGFTSIVQLAWPALVCLAIYCVYLSQKDGDLDASLLFASVFLILASVKYITNPSPNHISFLFIVVAGIVFRLKILKSDCSNTLGVGLAVLGFSILLLGIKNYSTQLYNTDLSFEYVKAPFSRIFKVEKSLVESINEIEQYANSDRVCLVAQNDDFYGVYFDKKFTGTLPNLSTNINSLVDVRKGLSMLGECNTVLISKSLLDDAETDYVITHFYNRSPRLNKFVTGYLHNVHKLKYLSHKYTEGMRPTGETKSFYIYNNPN